VDEIFDTWAANKMGIDRVGQVCVMIHSGSRGLGHQAGLSSVRRLSGSNTAMQVATDSLTAMERAMARDNIVVNDRQLACARINSQEGQDYLVCPQPVVCASSTNALQSAMACAANYAWVNRSSMTFLCRQVSFGQHLFNDGFSYVCSQAFAKMFNSTPDDLDMHVVYDVSHNIAKARSDLLLVQL